MNSESTVIVLFRLPNAQMFIIKENKRKHIHIHIFFINITIVYKLLNKNHKYLKEGRTMASKSAEFYYRHDLRARFVASRLAFLAHKFAEIYCSLM